MSQSQVSPAPSDIVADSAPRAPWSDPVCHDVSIAEITQINPAPAPDGIVLS